MNESDYPSYGIVDLVRITSEAPRLLAWGTMLDLPRRVIIEMIVDLADTLPGDIHDREINAFDVDYLKDVICYVYDDHPTHIDRVELGHTYEFEALVIEAAATLRRVIGREFAEVHLVDIRQSETLVLEMHRAHYTGPSGL